MVERYPWAIFTYNVGEGLVIVCYGVYVILYSYTEDVGHRDKWL